VRHPAKFVLIGSGNPEEGELRPQLLDRFGLSVEVTTPGDLSARVEVVKRRDAFERDAAGFIRQWQPEEEKLRRRIVAGRKKLSTVEVSDPIIHRAAELCMKLGTDGLRGEMTLVRAARALAAFDGARAVRESHLVHMAPMALRHRLRRDPLDEAGSTARVMRAVDEVFASNTARPLAAA
jgi:magnesium chelatase subunit I